MDMINLEDVKEKRYFLADSIHWLLELINRLNCVDNPIYFLLIINEHDSFNPFGMGLLINVYIDVWIVIYLGNLLIILIG